MAKKKAEDKEEQQIDYREIESPAMPDELALFILRRSQDRCPLCGIGVNYSTSETGWVDEENGYCKACRVTWPTKDDPIRRYKLWYKPRDSKAAKEFLARISADKCPKCGIQLHKGDATIDTTVEGWEERVESDLVLHDKLRDQGDSCKGAGYCHSLQGEMGRIWPELVGKHAIPIHLRTSSPEHREP